jgi:peptide/nickel transport system substrate-binding protein
MIRIHRTSFVAVFGLLLAALTACGPVGGDTPAQDGGTPLPVTVTVPGKAELVICTTDEPESLFGDPSAGIIWEAVGMTAAGSDGAFGALPRALVELPTPENGGLTRNTDGTLAVRLRYRDDLTWSDGQPFSAEDALLGILASPDVIEAKTIDEQTLSVTLAREAGYPYVPGAPPLPSHALEGVAPEAIASSAYAERIDPALGPYVMESWTRGDSIVMTANPHYAGGLAFPTLIVRFVPDSTTLVNDLLAEGCDVAADAGLSAADLPALQGGVQSGQARLAAGPGALWEHVDFNTTPTDGRTPFFADARARQAVAYAVNRGALAESVGSGFTSLLDSWLPPGHWAYPSDEAALTRYPYEPARAQELLSQAGWRGSGTLTYAGQGGDYGCLRGGWQIEEGTPFRVTLLTNAGDDLRATIANQIQADLGAVGIQVAIETVEPATLFDPRGPMAQRAFDMALFAWPSTPEPGGVNWWLGADLYRHPLTNDVVHDWQLDERFERASVELFAPTNIPSAANDYRGQNLSGWCDEAANQAIFQASYALSLGERQAAYVQQQTILSQQVPSLPLVQRLRVSATRPEICGVAPGPFAPLTWNVAQWTYDAEGTCGG